MHLTVKGQLDSLDDLPRTSLPSNAIKFDEPDTLEGVARASMPYALGALAFAVLLVPVGSTIGADNGVEILSWAALTGAIMSFLLIGAHEFIHALCLPAQATAELWWSLKDGMFFITTTDPLSKARYIVMSLAPNIVLGLVPLLIWTFAPLPGMLGTYLYVFGAIMLANGGGDLLNVVNALRQMPQGSIMQMSGVNSYWYLPPSEPPQEG